MCALAVLAATGALPPGVAAEQASEPTSTVAGQLDAGAHHTCAVLGDGTVRCWGYGGDGQLGYGNTANVGDKRTPGSAGPVSLGFGRTAKAISAGDFHTCALLDDGTVRCWGFGADGRLGYGNTNTIGAIPGMTPGTVGPVKLGAGHTATAITAGGAHTCALLDDGTVRCWGLGSNGQLGYGTTSNVGDNQTPGSVSPVDLGAGRTAKAISAGDFHTCALLDDGTVRCWGFNGDGELGYANTNTIGDDESPGSAGPVDLGAGRTAVAISAGGRHTCALLDDASVRCWGLGSNGELGYGNTSNVGDDETPGSVGPADLGAGRRVVAISAGARHTCALLDDASVRCWGYGGNGRLGYCNQNNVGDKQAPGSAGPVDLQHDRGADCDGAGTAPGTGGSHSGSGSLVVAFRLEALRARGLRGCLAKGPHRTVVNASRERRICLRLYGRTPGRVTGLRARALSRTKIGLSFTAPGTDGSDPPAAHSYLVKQSLHPIRDAPSFAHAQPLCKGRCRFSITAVGGKISLTITDLQPRTTYFYAIAALDNVSANPGPRSATVRQRTP